MSKYSRGHLPSVPIVMWYSRRRNNDYKKQKEENQDNHSRRKPTCLRPTELAREHGFQKCHNSDRNCEPSYDRRTLIRDALMESPYPRRTRSVISNLLEHGCNCEMFQHSSLEPSHTWTESPCVVQYEPSVTFPFNAHRAVRIFPMACILLGQISATSTLFARPNLPIHEYGNEK
jgi:hypothetical protein